MITRFNSEVADTAPIGDWLPLACPVYCFHSDWGEARMRPQNIARANLDHGLTTLVMCNAKVTFRWPLCTQRSSHQSPTVVESIIQAQTTSVILSGFVFDFASVCENLLKLCILFCPVALYLRKRDKANFFSATGEKITLTMIKCFSDLVNNCRILKQKIIENVNSVSN